MANWSPRGRAGAGDQHGAARADPAADGSIGGNCFLAVQDISAAKQAEAELERYRRDLEALVSERTAALEVANHALKRIAWMKSPTQWQACGVDRAAATGQRSRPTWRVVPRAPLANA